MQAKSELIKIILTGRPNVGLAQASEWAEYLSQLSGCSLFSVAAQEEDPAGWLRARTFGIGGSDIATVMGENKWSSPRQIWMSKLNMFDADKQPTQSEAARWGNLLETSVATEWGMRNNRQWIHIPVTLQSDTHPWMLANVDGFTLTDDRRVITGILEIKTTSAYNEDVWKEGPLPFNYMCQTNWYCGICGLKQFTIVCLVGGQHMYFYEMPTDPDLFARETREADTFWNVNVKQGIEPKANDVDVEKLAEEEHDPDLPPVVLTDEESARVVDSYCSLREKISMLEKVKKALYAQIYVYLGKGTQGIIGDKVITVSTSNRRAVNYEQLAKEFPEAYRACVSYSVSNSLSIR